MKKAYIQFKRIQVIVLNGFVGVCFLCSFLSFQNSFSRTEWTVTYNLSTSLFWKLQTIAHKKVNYTLSVEPVTFKDWHSSLLIQQLCRADESLEGGNALSSSLSASGNLFLRAPRHTHTNLQNVTDSQSKFSVSLPVKNANFNLYWWEV